MSAELTFNAEKHEYRFKGKIMPSVTTVLSAVGLYDFDFVSRDTLAVAAERGTIIHRCVEWYEQNLLDVDSIDPELRGYFDGYLKAKSDRAIGKPLSIETRLYSLKYWYAGTLDQLFNGWINDIKTGAPGAEHGLQLSAYWLALHPDLSDKPKRLTCTYLTRDGKYELRDYKYEPLAWLAVLGDYKWRVANGKIKQRWAA